jgi:ABC-type transporter Mla MlaB component
MGTPAPSTVRIPIEGPIFRDDVPALCDRVDRVMAESGAQVLICDITDVEVDAVAVEALLRLQLGARRHGCRVRLCGGAPPELLELVELMGLTNVLPCAELPDERA